MTLFESIILGIVEAATEYLPVSSTGHLILTSHLLGLEQDAFHSAFEIVIQGGSILAVIWHYRDLLSEHLKKVLQKNPGSQAFFLKIFIAFLPAATVGFLFRDFIKSYLFGPKPVVYALVVGGIVMIILERYLENKPDSKSELSLKEAFGVGVVQVLSLWPGTSRAMTTLLGGRCLGLSPFKAAEFSFLLAIPVLLAATGYELLKTDPQLIIQNWVVLLVGVLVSFVTSIFVIRLFLSFLKKHSLEVFGWYRIIVGIVFYFFFVK